MIIDAIMQGIKQSNALSLKTDTYDKFQKSGSFQYTAADRNFESYLKAEREKPDLPEKQYLQDTQLNNPLPQTPVKESEPQSVKKYEPNEQSQNSNAEVNSIKKPNKPDENAESKEYANTDNEEVSKADDKQVKNAEENKVSSKTIEKDDKAKDAKVSDKGTSFANKELLPNTIIHKIKALEQELAQQIKQEAKAEANIVKSHTEKAGDSKLTNSGLFSLNDNKDLLKFGELNKGERIIIKSEKLPEFKQQSELVSKSDKPEMLKSIESKIENDSNNGQKNIFVQIDKPESEKGNTSKGQNFIDEKINPSGEGKSSGTEKEFGKDGKEPGESGNNSKSKSLKIADNTAKSLILNNTIAEKSYNTKVSKVTSSGSIIDVKIDDISSKTLQLAKSLTPGMSTKAKLILKPDSLGTVFVDLRMDADKLSINFRADHSDTAKLLESKLADLKEKLSRQGIKVENFEIRLKNENGEFGGTDKDPGRNAQGKKEEQDLRKKFTESFRYNIIEDAVAE